jgi:hypothetical protein
MERSRRLGLAGKRQSYSHRHAESGPALVLSNNHCGDQIEAIFFAGPALGKGWGKNPS